MGGTAPSPWYHPPVTSVEEGVDLRRGGVVRACFSGQRSAAVGALVRMSEGEGVLKLGQWCTVASKRCGGLCTICS